MHLTSSEPRRRWLRFSLALLIAIAAWVAWGPTLRTIFTPIPDLSTATDEDFGSGLVTSAAHTDITGFIPCEYGWCLRPNTGGTFRYDFVAQGDRPMDYLFRWLDRERRLELVAAPQRSFSDANALTCQPTPTIVKP